MLTILSLWLFLSFIFLSFGDLCVCIYNRLSGSEDSYSIIDTFLLGLFFLLIPLSITSFWLPANEYMMYAYIAIGVVYWILQASRLTFIIAQVKDSVSKLTFVQKAIFVVSILSLAFYAVWSATIFDASFYHHQYVRWTEEYSIVPGLANLESRFGFNSNYLLLSAPFTLRFIWGDPVFLIQSLLSAFIVCWILKYIISSGFSIKGLVLLFLYTLLFSFPVHQLHDSSTDALPALVTFYFGAKYILDPSQLRKNYLLPVFVPIALGTFKLSVIPFAFISCVNYLASFQTKRITSVRTDKQSKKSFSVLKIPQKEFISTTLCLFLSIKGRINFSQLARYSGKCEQYFRGHFSKKFDFLSFNKSLLKKTCSKEVVLAFDPSYIKKSGKHTEGLSRFWSGCAGKVKRGLEICGIAALDVTAHTALHLLAVQTIPLADETLMDFYVRIFKERAEQLQEVSKTIVADAYFSKFTFCEPLIELGFTIISRLRDDAVLFYTIEKGQRTGKRGRPPKKGKRIDINKLDMNIFKLIHQNKDKHYKVLAAKVYCQSLKREIVVNIMQYGDSFQEYKIYFSTNEKNTKKKIWKIYQLRFQIEFLYRDAKQHVGLETGQARSKGKLHNHFNMSLTAVNIAKLNYWYSIPKKQRRAFSMADAKTLNHNTLMLNLFLSRFAIDPNRHKNKQIINEILLFGTRAA